MKTRIRLCRVSRFFLALAITFLFAFTNSKSARCEAAGSNGGPAFSKTSECQQTKPKYPLGQEHLNGMVVQLHDTFMMNGRMYHLVFARPEDYRKVIVGYVYIYPDGFKSGTQNRIRKHLPKVSEFIVHNVPGQELWGSVIVQEITIETSAVNKHSRYNITNTYTDVRLPDEQAQKILDLIQDNSSYENGTDIKYNRVETSTLRKTKIWKEVDGKATTEYSNQRKF